MTTPTTPRELLRWQWQGYARYHQSAGNLRLHIVAVPLFIAGNVLFLAGILRLAPQLAALGLLVSIASFAAQGVGHKREVVPSEPFASAGQAILRVLFEQWITFPRFVFSGGWSRNLRAARGRAALAG